MRTSDNTRLTSQLYGMLSNLFRPAQFGNGATPARLGKTTARVKTDTRKPTGKTALPAGAVRRSSPVADQEHYHLGKLTAAAAIVAGALVWTTGSSGPLTDKDANNQDYIQAAVSSPSFFFDDQTDALDRTHPQPLINQNPDPALTTATASKSFSTPPLEKGDALAQPLGKTADIVEPGITDALKTASSITVGATGKLSNESNAALGNSDTLKNDSSTGTSIVGEQLALAVPLTEIPEKREPVTPSNDEPSTPASLPTQNGPLHTQVKVASGDTLSGILNNHGLKLDQLRRLVTNELVKKHLSNIEVGQIFDITHDMNGEFTSMTTRLGKDKGTRLTIERSATGFDVTKNTLPIERRRVVASGKINQSLYLAAEQADLKQSTIMDLANIFQWELDFARDTRKGDKFSLVYDRLYREGKYIGDGDILAAEFIRGGKPYTAIRFTTDDGTTGYYTPEGQSKRRTFMRHPVDVVRITSKFNPNRLHPVLHKIRAHRGVDYGSPSGTPIYATADGKVIYSGSKNAYGNTVILKHGDQFTTLYAHMSRISKKSKVGNRVKQGDVIGYVGKTGRVTGAHLHYEFRVNGKQIDPLKVKLPAAKPLAEEYRLALTTVSNEMSALMDQAIADTDKLVASGPELQEFGQNAK